jgi:hypothetical protein
MKKCSGDGIDRCLLACANWTPRICVDKSSKRRKREIQMKFEKEVFEEKASPFVFKPGKILRRHLPE